MSWLLGLQWCTARVDEAAILKAGGGSKQTSQIHEECSLSSLSHQPVITAWGVALSCIISFSVNKLVHQSRDMFPCKLSFLYQIIFILYVVACGTLVAQAFNTLFVCLFCSGTRGIEWNNKLTPRHHCAFPCPGS